MTLSKETESHINEHLSRLNKEAKAPWYKKLQSYVTALSITTAVIGLYNWKETIEKLEDAETKLAAVERETKMQIDLAQTKVNNARARSEDYGRQIARDFVILQQSQENYAVLQSSIGDLMNEMFQSIQLADDKKEALDELEQKYQAYESALADLETQRDSLQEKERVLNSRLIKVQESLDTYADYVDCQGETDCDGYYTKEALRDLISIQYVKIPRKINGVKIPFTRPYAFAVFLTYPEFAQEQLDEQILSVSYPDLVFKDGKPLLIREKVSTGGLRFVGYYDGYDIPVNLRAVINYATLFDEDTVTLKQCYVEDEKRLCEDKLTIVK